MDFRSILYLVIIWGIEVYYWDDSPAVFLVLQSCGMVPEHFVIFRTYAHWVWSGPTPIARELFSILTKDHL